MKLAVAGLLLLGCGCSQTEVVFIIETELDVPEEMDSVSIRHTAPNGRRGQLAVTSRDDFPLVHVMAQTSDVERFLLAINAVKAQDGGGEDVVIVRTIDAPFVPGEQKAYRVVFSRSCLDVVCNGGTCEEGMCRSATVEPSEFQDWDGEP